MDPNNPVTLLVPLIGIGLILLAVWLTGGKRQPRLDRALVLRRLAEDLPDFAAADLAIDAEGAAAIVAGTDPAALAIVFAVGDKLAVRRLRRSDVRRVTAAARRLVIETDDFTHGRFELILPDDAEHWVARLALLQPEQRAA